VKGTSTTMNKNIIILKHRINVYTTENIIRNAIFSIMEEKNTEDKEKILDILINPQEIINRLPEEEKEKVMSNSYSYQSIVAPYKGIDPNTLKMVYAPRTRKEFDWYFEEIKEDLDVLKKHRKYILKGASLLDDLAPGWWKTIDIGNLSFRKIGGSVLCLVFNTEEEEAIHMVFAEKGPDTKLRGRSDLGIGYRVLCITYGFQYAIRSDLDDGELESLWCDLVIQRSIAELES
jgi:hypothetical protein